AQDLLFGRRDADAGLGKLVWNDAWDGYGPARRRLTDALQRHRVPNPVILGGDIHENWVGHVKADYDRPDSASVGVEFCGTSISSRASSYPGFDKLVAENPHFVFADRDRRGYGLVTLTPQRLETELRAVRDVADAESPVDVLARFGVASGRAELEHSLK
ncbi:MAG: alkaline phosphatase D family protein, partial [Ottowia sp.]|nr:alkaline phosphatase D family protein [Ottowia sp.]